VANAAAMPPSRVILDTSFLLTEEAMDWITDPELQPWFVVSNALVDRLADPDLIDEWGQFGVRADADQLRKLVAALEPIERFSHREFEDLSEPAGAIRRALLEDGPLGEVFADEWVFLTTQSLGVFAFSRRTLDRFIRAGAHVYDVANEAMERGLAAISEHLPPWLVDDMKKFARFPHRRTPKLILLGGLIAAFFVPAVGLGAGVLASVQMGTGVIAGDP
jgi:hypothetical protein